MPLKFPSESAAKEYVIANGIPCWIVKITNAIGVREYEWWVLPDASRVPKEIPDGIIRVPGKADLVNPSFISLYCAALSGLTPGYLHGLLAESVAVAAFSIAREAFRKIV